MDFRYLCLKNSKIFFFNFGCKAATCLIKTACSYDVLQVTQCETFLWRVIILHFSSHTKMLRVDGMHPIQLDGLGHFYKKSN